MHCQQLVCYIFNCIICRHRFVYWSDASKLMMMRDQTSWWRRKTRSARSRTSSVHWGRWRRPNRLRWWPLSFVSRSNDVRRCLAFLQWTSTSLRQLHHSHCWCSRRHPWERTVGVTVTNGIIKYGSHWKLGLITVGSRAFQLPLLRSGTHCLNSVISASLSRSSIILKLSFSTCLSLVSTFEVVFVTYTTVIRYWLMDWLTGR